MFPRSDRVHADVQGSRSIASGRHQVQIHVRLDLHRAYHPRLGPWSGQERRFVTAACATGASRARLLSHYHPQPDGPHHRVRNRRAGTFYRVRRPPVLHGHRSRRSSPSADPPLRRPAHQPDGLHPTWARPHTILSFIMMGDAKPRPEGTQVSETNDPPALRQGDGADQSNEPSPPSAAPARPDIHPDDAQPLLKITDLRSPSPFPRPALVPVRGANLTIYPGQTVAIVGESDPGPRPPPPSSACCPAPARSRAERRVRRATSPTWTTTVGGARDPGLRPQTR